MKLLKKTLVGVAVAAALATSAQAGVVALADMNIYTLGFTTAIDPSSLTISGESRTGTAAANYNGVVASGVGAGSITDFGSTTVDVGYRCAGACGAATAALYGGSIENATNHITVPGGANYALGDMKISGNALGGSVVGLTRADSVATGPTNSGGANSTILNSGSITGSFTFADGFTTRLVLGVDALLQSWIDPTNSATEQALASAGYGWTMDVSDNAGLVLHFSPSQVNKTFNTSSSANNKFFAYNGYLYSDLVTFNAGTEYTFSINQSSNSTIRDIPEPESLALVGLGLLGLAAARRRKAA